MTRAAPDSMQWLFVATALELFLGGGGRLTELGPLTLRMILFSGCLVAWLLWSIRNRQRADNGQFLALSMVSTYLAVYAVAFGVGSVKGCSVAECFGDIQQSLYWLAAPFFAAVLASRGMVLRAAAIVRFSGTLMSAGYLVLIALLATGVLNFREVYELIYENGEFYFRGDSFFFYKGFLYIGLSAVFILALRGRRWPMWLAVVTLALILTLTRGFVLSVCVAALLLLLIQRRWKGLSMAALGIAVAGVFAWFYVQSLGEAVLTSKEMSSSVRQNDAQYIVGHLSPQILLIGDGLGSVINGRMNIENTYLWALWKLGLPGLVFWLLPFGVCAFYYARIPRHSKDFDLASAFLCCVIFVYVETSTNPYLNNPIGLSFVMMAMFSIRTLARERRTDIAESVTP